jgi:multisubunit Na+/H+ antiporter MnhF subunit
MIALALAVGLPIVLLQLYKIYVGPVSFDAQLGFGILVSILAGLILYYTYRSSAQNQP